MKDMLDDFHAANPWDGLDWDRESVTFVWEDAPGGVIELTITIADAGADGRVCFETEVRQGDVIHTMREDADAIKDLLPNTVWPYALANGYGLQTLNADMDPYNAITSILDMFAYSEKMRAFEQIERTIRDLDKLLAENWSALSDEFKLHNPRVALWNLHYFVRTLFYLARAVGRVTTFRTPIRRFGERLTFSTKWTKTTKKRSERVSWTTCTRT